MRDERKYRCHASRALRLVAIYAHAIALPNATANAELTDREGTREASRAPPGKSEPAGSCHCDTTEEEEYQGRGQRLARTAKEEGNIVGGDGSVELLRPAHHHHRRLPGAHR